MNRNCCAAVVQWCSGVVLYTHSSVRVYVGADADADEMGIGGRGLVLRCMAG